MSVNKHKDNVDTQQGNLVCYEGKTTSLSYTTKLYFGSSLFQLATTYRSFGTRVAQNYLLLPLRRRAAEKKELSSHSLRRQALSSLGPPFGGTGVGTTEEDVTGGGTPGSSCFEQGTVAVPTPVVPSSGSDSCPGLYSPIFHFTSGLVFALRAPSVVHDGKIGPSGN